MIKLALVGRGVWGQNYIQTIRKMSDCQLPQEYIETRNYSQLFKKKDIAGVIIATPPFTHHKIAKDFLEKGFNVLVEKPLTTRYEDALELQKLANKTKAVAMVGHIYLYNPAFLETKEIVNKMKNVKYIFSERMNYNKVSKTPALWDWAPHDISMGVDIFGAPNSVFSKDIDGKKEKSKMCSFYLNFSGGIKMFSVVGWLSPIKKRSMLIVGEKEAVCFDDIAKDKITYFKDLKENIVGFPKYSSQQPLTLEVMEFVKCIKNKKKPKTDLEQGALTVKIIEALEKSIKNGREIRL
ncbi:MAG: Gfo/Idh/MocA family oxidoreductase [Candidatus Levybacteria bacterium]|nr:Gfo/Idh/MocA family oxidoreductase [Candidatus Levybacteria bacterium]